MKAENTQICSIGSAYIMKSITLGGNCCHLTIYYFNQDIVFIDKCVFTKDDLTENGYEKMESRSFFGKYRWVKEMSFKLDTLLSIAGHASKMFQNINP